MILDIAKCLIENKKPWHDHDWGREDGTTEDKIEIWPQQNLRLEGWKGTRKIALIIETSAKSIRHKWAWPSQTTVRRTSWLQPSEQRRGSRWCWRGGQRKNHAKLCRLLLRSLDLILTPLGVLSWGKFYDSHFSKDSSN